LVEIQPRVDYAGFFVYRIWSRIGPLAFLPERTLVFEMFHSLSGEVVVAADRLPADVAHEGAAVAAGDLVTAVLKRKRTNL